MPSSRLPCPPHPSTVTDVTVNAAGLAVAGISVVSSGLQQLLCGTVQRKHKLQAHQLLANTAPVQGAMLLVLGPPIDFLITGRRVTQYAWTGRAAAVMAASCSVAVLVNISQVGRTRAGVSPMREGSRRRAAGCAGACSEQMQPGARAQLPRPQLAGTQRPPLLLLRPQQTPIHTAPTRHCPHTRSSCAWGALAR